MNTRQKVRASAAVIRNIAAALSSIIGLIIDYRRDAVLPPAFADTVVYIFL